MEYFFSKICIAAFQELLFYLSFTPRSEPQDSLGTQAGPLHLHRLDPASHTRSSPGLGRTSIRPFPPTPVIFIYSSQKTCEACRAGILCLFFFVLTDEETCSNGESGWCAVILMLSPGLFPLCSKPSFLYADEPIVAVTLSCKMKQCHNYKGLGINGTKWVIWV